MFFWDMICSHENISNTFLLHFFNRLDANKHTEAMGYLYDILKCSEPTYELVKMMVMRRCEDNLARSLLINWSRDSGTCMAQMFVRLLKASLNAANHQSPSSACSSANQSAIQQASGGVSGGILGLSGLSKNNATTTMKKIKYNESLSANNKVYFLYILN